MTTYKEIRKITGNNKMYAARAYTKMVETMDWVIGQTFDTIYLRSADNDWVAIPDYYTDEIDNGEIEFTTIRGKSVILSADDNANYIAVESEI